MFNTFIFSIVFEIKSGELIIGRPFASRNDSSLFSIAKVWVTPCSNSAAKRSFLAYKLPTNSSAICLFDELIPSDVPATFL